ncbi:MAG: metallophosphoesterase [Deltaproteobacteria bacterium]|nr:metallophosphoesterase [Deltaproteobacteria bacterium]
MFVFLITLLLGGCGGTKLLSADTDTPVTHHTDGGVGTGTDADTGTSENSGADSSSDTGTKPGPDTGPDTGPEAGTDSGTAQPIHVEAKEWTGDARIIAIGDNHADLSQAQRALQIAQVINENLVWIGKDTIVVQTGDVIDRGTEEREVIDFYERLRPEAAAAGGQIINMNGNHEIMTAQGDYRYMQENACAAFSSLPGLDTSNPAFENLTSDCKKRAAAFWPGGPYAKIIADWPMVVVLDKTVFVHGGLHQKHIDYGIDKINEMTRAWLLGEGELDTDMVGGGTAVYSVDWDRTYSSNTLLPEETICAAAKNVLDQLGADRMVMGHTVQTRIIGFCDGRIVRIDVGMAEYYGGNIEVLEIIDGRVTVLVDTL